MPTLSIIDDLQAPSDTIKLKFRGSGPASALGMIPDLLKNTMKISSKDLLETDMRWDVNGEEHTFYGVWMGKRLEDRWSKTFIRVLLQGGQNPKDKMGWFELQVKGTIDTNYNYSNFFQRWFWWFYNRQFYHGQRQRYIDEGRADMNTIKEEIASRFKILQEE